MQNADHARARRFSLQALPGWPDAGNPLLQGLRDTVLVMTYLTHPANDAEIEIDGPLIYHNSNEVTLTVPREIYRQIDRIGSGPRVPPFTLRTALGDRETVGHWVYVGSSASPRDPAFVDIRLGLTGPIVERGTSN